MKPTESLITEFAGLHSRYMRANERMLPLQGAAVEGMRKIGVGCVSQKSKEEFMNLKIEIESVLARMKEICSTLD